jgi:acyl-CoA thioester hydrolase
LPKTVTASEMHGKRVFYQGQVLWSQVDANRHLRHSAYADFGAQGRIEALRSVGITDESFREFHIGPILFREELLYLREVQPGDTLHITCEVLSMRSDGSRWSFRQEMYRSDGVKAAQINTDGAWIDTRHRKLSVIPETLRTLFHTLPRCEEFTLTD